MPRNYHSVRGRPQGAPNSLDVLGLAHHGGQVWRLLWPYLQGIPLFKVSMGTVIRHWVKVVVATEVGIEVLSLFIRDLKEYFYSGDGLVASTRGFHDVL